MHYTLKIKHFYKKGHNKLTDITMWGTKQIESSTLALKTNVTTIKYIVFTKSLSVLLICGFNTFLFYVQLELLSITMCSHMSEYDSVCFHMITLSSPGV